VAAVNAPCTNRTAAPASNNPESAYVSVIMGLRPQVSNSRPSSSGAEEVGEREGHQVETHALRGHVEETPEHHRVGEEDRVVEKFACDAIRISPSAARRG